MAQSALSVFAISRIAENTIGVLPENLLGGNGKANLLLRRYSETATRTRTGIIGAISGCTIRAAYSDPILTIEIGGWVISRGGFANCAPGTLIDASIIANWRNGANGPGEEDHFGWDVMHNPGGANPSNYKFIVQDPSITRSPGGLSEVSLKLILECTGSGGGGGITPVENGGNTVPEVGGGPRIVTVYTNQGSYQHITYSETPTLDEIFGSSAGPWDMGVGGRRPISGAPLASPDATPFDPPILVYGVNTQAATGYGSVSGGVWMAGSAAEVTGGGQTLKPSGMDMWFFVLPYTGTLGRESTFLVTGIVSQSAALSSIAHVSGDFVGIYNQTPTVAQWTQGEQQGSPTGWFRPPGPHGA
jgi:hypothetical protein